MSTPIPGSSPLMGGFIARLSQRERVLLGMLLLVFFVISVSVLFMLRSTAMAEKQKSIDELRRGLDLVYTRGTVYDLKKKEKAAREARIASIQPLILATSTVYTRYVGRGVTVGAGHFAHTLAQVTDLLGTEAPFG